MQYCCVFEESIGVPELQRCAKWYRPAAVCWFQDPSGHSRTSTASSRSQWALPDLNRELQIAVPDLNRDFQVAVGTAGPQPRAPDRSGHCRTSTATSRSQWALPDLNRELQIPVGTAGPQRPDRMPEDMPDRMPEDMSDRMPEDMPDRMPEDLPDRMPEDMPDRMPEDMSDRMPEDLPDRMPEDMPEHMPEDMPDRMPEDMSDRMPEDLPVRKCINVMVGITRSKVFFSRVLPVRLLTPRSDINTHGNG